MANTGRRALSILCVDSDPDMIVILELALVLDPEIDVSIAIDTDTAGRLLESGAAFDVVLIDIQLAQSDVGLLRKIVRPDGSPPTPVLLLSSDSKLPDRLAKVTGVLGLILKPFHPIHLAATVRAFLMQVDKSTPF